MNRIRKIFEKFNINTFVSESVPLAERTTFKIGGNARYFAVPATIDNCRNLFAAVREAGLTFFILGGGSNVVMPDEGFDGVIVSTEQMHSLSLLPQDNGCVIAEVAAGTCMRDVAEFLCDKSLAGLAAFAGLPGSAGGAVFMNARCYGTEIADVVDSVTILNLEDNEVCTVPFNKSAWSYKHSPFQDGNCLILSVRFAVSVGDKAAIRAEMDANIADRTSKGHFSYPSAGSVFKNNREFGKPSGSLIDEAGGNGMTCGGVQVAPWHGNFIINHGNGTAADVKKLVNDVQRLVVEKFGCQLECEIIFVQNPENV